MDSILEYGFVNAHFHHENTAQIERDDGSVIYKLKEYHFLKLQSFVASLV